MLRTPAYIQDRSCIGFLGRVQIYLNKPFPKAVTTMRPHAVPIGNALNLSGIDRLSEHAEIAVNRIGFLEKLLIEKLSGLLQ